MRNEKMGYLKTGLKLLAVNFLTMLLMLPIYFVLMAIGVKFGLAVILVLFAVYLLIYLFVGGFLAKKFWKWK